MNDSTRELKRTFLLELRRGDEREASASSGFEIRRVEIPLPELSLRTDRGARPSSVASRASSTRARPLRRETTRRNSDSLRSLSMRPGVSG